jgi:TrpR-related protein YerC/YecD
MSQLSKLPIRRDLEDEMFDLFTSTIISLKDKKEIEDFLSDLLSPIEKMMLAKRLAIALMLEKDYTYPMIGKTLRVTPTTIASVSMQLRYAGKGYKNIVEKILSSGEYDTFWETVEDVVDSTVVSKPKSKDAKKTRRRKR